MSALPRVAAADASPLRARVPAIPQGGWMQREQILMGAPARVQVWADDRARGAAAMAAVMAELQRIERCWSPARADSELARVNAAAALRPVPIGDELFQLLARSQEYSRLTGGAFDISCGSAALLYDPRTARVPDDISLARAVQAIGWRQLQLDPLTPAVRFARPGMHIDLGGIAKGWALERCRTLLAKHGVRHALVSAGGDTRVLGDRRGRPWPVAIRDPRHADAVLAVLPLADLAVSTSSDGAGSFVRDGVRHHRVLDPRTGRSPQHVRSVSIVAGDGLAAEALAKAVFVLGVERGLQLVHEQQGVDAVIVDADGRLHVSRGFDALEGQAAERLERA